jgi:predicted helicase
MRRVRVLTDATLSADEIVERTGVREKVNWTVASKRASFAPPSEARVVPWLYRLLDRRFLYWDPAMMGRPGAAVMRHLLPRPFGDGGENRLALIVQRARPIGTMATITRGIATAHVTGQWCHVYPLHLADVAAEGTLFAADSGWIENLEPALASAIRRSLGGDVSVETIATYVLAVISAPAYRRAFAAPLEIDHPRIPFPADAGVFAAMSALGAELASAHLMEADVTPDIRFEGEGSNRVDEARHDPATGSVWINTTQLFTGVPEAAWAWGGAFRPLEHWLADRRGRTLDLAQLEQYQRAIHAVREAIRLEPLLDEQLARVLAAPLGFGAAE